MTLQQRAVQIQLIFKSVSLDHRSQRSLKSFMRRQQWSKPADLSLPTAQNSLKILLLITFS